MDVPAIFIHNHKHYSMKKLFKVLLPAMLLLVVLSMSATAQDTITKNDGSVIQAKVLEITSTEVKYKRYNNLEGPLYVLNKTEVSAIKYENGEKDVFTGTSQSAKYKFNTTHEVKDGMKFSEYKKLYNVKDYVHQVGDPYNPGLAGAASFLIPGLGQALNEAWGDAVLCFLTDLLIDFDMGISYYGMINNVEPYKTQSVCWFALSCGLKVFFDVFCIVDAVNVAKVKNMYNQDLRGPRLVQPDYSVSPFVTASPDMGSGSFALTGLSLTLSF